MDYVARQFINLTKKFRKELRPLLSRLNATLEKQTEAIHESAQAAKRENSPPPDVSVHVHEHFPESIEIHQKEKAAKQEWNFRFISVLVSGASIGIIAVYATLDYWQYQQMVIATGAAQDAVTEARYNRLQAQRAFNATVDQFRLDQRAWVVLRESYILPAAAGEIRITLNVVNAGKSPAKDLHQAASFYVAPRPVLRGPPENGSMHLQFRPTAPIAPGSRSEVHTVIKVSDLGADYDAITHGRKIIYEFGEIRYKYVFDNPHSTTFCLYQANPTDQLFSTCERGNSIE
jgi:hypothetical protein